MASGQRIKVNGWDRDRGRLTAECGVLRLYSICGKGDPEAKLSLGYIMSLRPACAIYRDPEAKNQTREQDTLKGSW